jgi:hypothetical protein
MDENAAYGETQSPGTDGQPVYDLIIERAVTLREMPPQCGGMALGMGACLSEEEAALLEAWVEQGALP